MSGERPPHPPLHRLRITAAGIFLGIDLLIVVADVGGRLFIRDDFHVDPLLFGMAFGTTLTLLGLEGMARLTGPKQ